MEFPEEFEVVCQQWQERKLPFWQAAATLGMNHTTFYRKYSQKY
jgi:predicted DNA-binding transcriptional regulator AlpA